MKTRNKILFSSIIILFAFFFVSWNMKYHNLNNETSKNIIVLVKYKSQPAKEKDAVLALTTLIENVKQEPHFVNIKLHIDPKDRTNILLYEEWSDETYYNSKHMMTSHLQKFIGESKNFLAGPPEISFWHMEKDFK